MIGDNHGTWTWTLHDGTFHKDQTADNPLTATDLGRDVHRGRRRDHLLRSAVPTRGALPLHPGRCGQPPARALFAPTTPSSPSCSPARPGSASETDRPDEAMEERAANCRAEFEHEAFVFSDAPGWCCAVQPNRLTQAPSCGRERATAYVFHDLHHWHASQLLGVGKPPVVVAERLGPPRPSTPTGRHPPRRGDRRLLWPSTSCMWSGRGDLNPRPPAPKAGALPGCATPRGHGKATGFAPPRPPGVIGRKRRPVSDFVSACAGSERAHADANEESHLPAAPSAHE